MDKVKHKFFFLFFIGMVVSLMIGCNTKPDFSSEIKTIDSLETEVKKSLAECKTMDTSWVHPLTKKANYNVKMIKTVYNPDTINVEEVSAITYYKGFRKLGMGFVRERQKMIEEFNKTLKQLKDLKTDAENAALSKEDLKKFILEEKSVTTELIYKFNDMKYTTIEVLKNYDSLTPKIEKLIEEHTIIFEEAKKMKSKKLGTTIH
jgi:hypothetical protein